MRNPWHSVLPPSLTLAFLTQSAIASLTRPPCEEIRPSRPGAKAEVAAVCVAGVGGAMTTAQRWDAASELLAAKICQTR